MNIFLHKYIYHLYKITQNGIIIIKFYTEKLGSIKILTNTHIIKICYFLWKSIIWSVEM